jgi:hypothetical protein
MDFVEAVEMFGGVWHVLSIVYQWQRPCLMFSTGGRMKTTAWNLIVMSPGSANMKKLRVSYKAGLICISAFVFGFLATTAFLVMFPHLQINESEHERLAAENQMLKVENKNLTLQIHKLDAQVVRVEERSKEVIALTKTD